MHNQCFVYHTVLRAVRNQDGNVTNFMFIEVDRSFERLLKPVADSVRGKRCSEVLSEIGVSGTDVMSTLRRAYEEGSTYVTEIFCQPLDIYFRIQATGNRDNTLTVYFADISAEHYLERQLVERRKKFKLILFLSNLNDITIPTREILERLVERIPGSWQYPERTYCKITLNGDEVTSQNYQPTQWKLRSVIRQDEHDIGYVEVGYLAAFSDMDIGPFMREEKELLDEIANRLSKIVENKAIYNKLQRIQSLLDNASTMANMGAWSVDLSTNKSTWSNQVARIHELPPGSAPGPEEGMSYYEPEFRNRIVEVFQQCAEEGIPYNEVMAIRTAKGNRRWVKTIGEAVRDEQGKIVKVQGAFQDITEIIETQQTLEKSEKQFRQIFYNHSAIKLIIDPTNGEIVFANQAAAQFYGWSIDELKSKSISEINVMEKNVIREKMRNVLKGEQSYFEFTHRKADGTLRDVEVFTSKVVMGDREYLHSIVHDVTDKKKAEEALIMNEKMLNAMISASPIAIYSVGTDDRVQSWNKASERIFGWTKQEALGKKLPEVPKHKQKEHKEIVERILAGDSITELELTRQKKDGKLIEISLSTAPITNEDQEIVSILAIASDITERKKKDDQILLHSTALNSVANAVIITDRDGNIEWINDAWSELTGYLEEEVLGGNPRILKSGEQDESFYEELWDTILSGEVWSGELINKKKDGSLYHELQTITPLMDADGEVTHLIGIKQDITQQKQIEEELRELVREKDVLLSEVHHRVKNNMAMLSAMMYLELIQTENEDVIENIQKNIHRINTIASVHELVYASEKWSKVNLEKIALQLVEPAQQDDESDCNVRVTVDSNPAFINVNQALPASMIINEMFRGMYKAACSEDRKSTLSIGVLESDGRIEISISKIGENNQSELPEMIDVLGMQLIDTLTQQLNGSVEYDTTADKSEVQLIFDRDDSVSGTSSAFLV